MLDSGSVSVVRCLKTRVCSNSFCSTVAVLLFLQEEEHEWGYPLHNHPNPLPIEAAARRWRLELRDRRLALEMSGGSSRAVVGAFENWRVLLSVQRSKQQGLKRLLEAGGAKVVKGG